MIYIEYIILAVIVVFLSIKLAKYVDLIDKTTNISGALIGGIILSAVTSLPELLTSISATVWLKNPSLCLGNILGSNLFNLAIIGVLGLFTAKSLLNSRIGSSHAKTTIFVLIVYIVLLLNIFGILNIEIATVAITSIIILVCYIFSIKYMSSDDNSAEADEEVAIDSSLTTKQIAFRFVLASICLIVSSIMITNVTDKIAAELNLGAGLAGALFLGIATSLPELSSSVSLFKMKNFNVAIGNIVGSSIFNFFILFVVDVLYVKGSIYSFADHQTQNLVFFGLLANIFMLLLLTFKDKMKNKALVISSFAGILLCYVLFLVL